MLHCSISKKEREAKEKNAHTGFCALLLSGRCQEEIEKKYQRMWKRKKRGVEAEATQDE